jgi:hypothetical protein
MREDAWSGHMSQLDRTAEATGPREPDAARRARDRSDRWIPRPSTILTALIVGPALLVAASIDPIVFGQLTGYEVPPPPIGRGAMTLGYLMVVALLASACLTTQILACRLVESPRWTIRSSCLWIAVVALLLALWRSESSLLLPVLMAALGYALASPMILVLLIAWRREPAGRT